VRFLLDTHVLLWTLASPRRLRKKTRDAISNPDNVIHTSVVSAWEIELKRALEKLDAPADLTTALQTTGLTLLPLRLEHIAGLRDLPNLHRDPFDRILAAQARIEGLILVTSDTVLQRYPVQTMAP